MLNNYVDAYEIYSLNEQEKKIPILHILTNRKKKK